MLTQGKYLYFGDDISSVYHIRDEVFCKEIGMMEQDEKDGMDITSVHVLIFSCDNTMKPVATGRISFDGDTYLIDKVCVIKEERNKYYGDFVVRMLVNKAFLSGASEVLVETYIQNIEFYKKIGFIVNGNVYKKFNEEYIKLIIKTEGLCKKCTK
jgi:predicted GNAT family N-acyltransferase